ncbi:hypothetical protein ACMFMG_011173 [Clarireedia jacksonii]
MSSGYTTRGKGKAYDLTTQWTPWEWDSRGFWASSRLNFYGEQEWKYEGATTESDQVKSSDQNDYQNPVLPISTTSTIYTDSSHYNTSSASAAGYGLTSPNDSIPRALTLSASYSRQQDYSSSTAQNIADTSSQYPGGMEKGYLSVDPSSAGPSTAQQQTRDGRNVSDLSHTWLTSRKIKHNPNAVLDNRYRAIPFGSESRAFWKEGRVFMMLWTEPAGENKSGLRGTKNFSHISIVYLGGEVYTEIRRFVVIKDAYGSASCLAIHTYSNQGTLKANLPDADNHAIIFTSPQCPPLHSQYDQNGILQTEQLSKDPIKVRSELHNDPDGDLGKMSRLNYTKVYTVEKDVRILNIGMVEGKSMNALRTDSPLKLNSSSARWSKHHS